MREKQVIDKLQLLKTVQPDIKTLRLIRGKISSPVTVSGNFNFRTWLTITPLNSLIAFGFVLIFFLVTLSFFPNLIDNTLVNVKIALAQNHYEKAKISLANVQARLVSVKENTSDITKMQMLSQSLALANKEMSGLQLVGEKGKYTSKQCEELYESYQKYLEIIATVPNIKKSGVGVSLITQAGQYDKQAKYKLNHYGKNWLDKKNR